MHARSVAGIYVAGYKDYCHTGRLLRDGGSYSKVVGIVQKSILPLKPRLSAGTMASRLSTENVTESRYT